MNPASLTRTAYLDYIGDDHARAWLTRIRKDQESALAGIPAAYFTITETRDDALAFAQIMYWSELSENGKPRIGYLFKDHYWIAKTYEQWRQELRHSSIREVRRVFDRLVARGLIVRERHKSRLHDLKTVMFIRVNWQVFGSLLTMVAQDSSVAGTVTSESPLVDTSECTIVDTSELTTGVHSEYTAAVTPSFPETTSSKIVSETLSETTSSSDAAGEDRSPLNAVSEPRMKPDDDDLIIQFPCLKKYSDQHGKPGPDLHLPLKRQIKRLGAERVREKLATLIPESKPWSYALKCLQNDDGVSPIQGNVIYTTDSTPLPGSAAPSPTAEKAIDPEEVQAIWKQLQAEIMADASTGQPISMSRKRDERQVSVKFTGRMTGAVQG